MQLSLQVTVPYLHWPHASEGGCDYDHGRSPYHLCLFIHGLFVVGSVVGVVGSGLGVVILGQNLCCCCHTRTVPVCG